MRTQLLLVAMLNGCAGEVGEDWEPDDEDTAELAARPSDCAAMVGPPSIRLTAPRPGFVVSRGEPLLITADVCAAGRLRSVKAVLEGPDGRKHTYAMSPVVRGLKARRREPIIPRKAVTGNYALAILAVDEEGQSTSSSPIVFCIDQCETAAPDLGSRPSPSDLATSRSDLATGPADLGTQPANDLAVVPTPSGAWSKKLGGTGGDMPAGVAVDRQGNIVVVGTFRGTTTLGGAAFTSVGENDVFVAKYSATGTHLWSKRLGSTSYDVASGVVVDAEGNIVIGGGFYGASFAGEGVSLLNASSLLTTDGFLIKYSAAGSVLWAKRFGDTNMDWVGGLAIGKDGNIAMTGTFAKQVDFGGVTLSSTGGGPDAFVVKLVGANGSALWGRSFFCMGPDVGIAVAVDSQNNIVLTGAFAGRLFFDGEIRSETTGHITHGLRDAYLLKYSGTGVFLWGQTYGGPLHDQGNAVAIDAVDNILLTGSYWGAVSLGGAVVVAEGGVSTTGGNEIFVAKYTSGGTHLWSKGFGDYSTDDGLGIAVDRSNNVVVTGRFWGRMLVGGALIGPAGNEKQLGFAAGFSPSGAPQWSRAFGEAGTFYSGASSAQGVAGATGPNGVVLVGSFSHNAEVGHGLHTSAGGTDVLLWTVGP